MRKVDRFDRCTSEIVYGRKYKSGDENYINYVMFVRPDAIAKLLRREHAWMRQMVRKISRWSEQELAESDDVIHAILDQLDKRKQ